MQLTDLRQVFSFVAICQEPIVSDFDKSVGQCMEQKPSDELNGLYGNLLDLFGFTILVCKGYLSINKRE